MKGNQSERRGVKLLKKRGEGGGAKGEDHFLVGEKGQKRAATNMSFIKLADH